MELDTARLATAAEEFLTISRRIIAQVPPADRLAEIKSDGSPVTQVDQAVEAALRAAILARFPDHGIIGEEYGSQTPDADYVWVIDPIDGTKQFLADLPLYSTLIGVLHHGRPLLGVMDFPATGDRWIGGTGLPSTRNGRAIRVRSCGALSRSVIAAGNPQRGTAAERDRTMALCETGAWALWGANCMTFGLVASGCLDLAIDSGLDLYDFAALVPVVEAAGGIVSDWRGQPLTRDSSGSILAAGDAALHHRALEILGTAD